jgi:cytochrome c-type biogenesis protein CcmH
VIVRAKAAEAADKRAGAIAGGESPANEPGPGTTAPDTTPQDTTKQEAAKPDAAKPQISAAGKSPPAGPTEADIEAAGKMKKEDQTAMVRGMVDRLAERLKTNPDDMAGWRRLGRSYLVLGEADKASDALAHAVALAPKNVDVLLDYGEALLNAAGPALAPTDRLPAKFLEIMNRVYTLDDNNPVALWYLGVDHAQAGRRAEAAVLWTRLMERLPPNAPERAALAKRLEMLKIDQKPEK